jgi:hypothetical protein
MCNDIEVVVDNDSIIKPNEDFVVDFQRAVISVN